MAIDQCDIVGLPLAPGKSCIEFRANAAKDCAGAIDSLHFAISVNDLCFVKTVDVDTAVAI